MTSKSRLLMILQTNPYFQKLKTLFGANLIAYYPMWEESGTTVTDISGNARNGVYDTVTLNSTRSKFNKPSPLFNGDGFANVYSASLVSAFTPNTLTIGGWYKAKTMNTFYDGAVGNPFRFLVDANNYVDLLKQSSAEQLSFRFKSGAVAVKTLNFYGATNNWFFWCITVDKANDLVSIYINNKKITTLDTLGIWAGSVAEASACFGAANTTKANPLIGYLSDCFIASRVATDAEIVALSKNLPQNTLTILGDSISVKSDTSYTTLILSELTTYFNRNRAVASMGVVAGASNLAAQATAAASDDADIIIIQLGSNDDNAGNMGTLQTAYEDGIIALKASNTNATIYAMNVLKRWANQTDGAEVDKSNIRTAIAAACTAQGITCWDTYTTPWIAQDETSDGIHPTAAGHAKIAAEVLARLP
ncbi:MAG: hypothetical protein UW18_C0011G0003 [Microgenomates group bacterium GW2011_GWF1_44_10]|nr:MAG: hypothetical protein UW18_C0011G0003 [Microgenomates group bacterium GW2011_GWF1_44_10]